MVITDEKVCWVKCCEPNRGPVAMRACGVKAQRRCGGGVKLQDWNWNKTVLVRFHGNIIQRDIWKSHLAYGHLRIRCSGYYILNNIHTFIPKYKIQQCKFKQFTLCIKYFVYFEDLKTGPLIGCSHLCDNCSGAIKPE